MSTRFSVIVGLTLVVGTLGCEEKKPQPPLGPAKMAPGATPPAAPGPAAAPAPGPAAGNDSTVVAQGVSLTLPAGWKRNPPANQMRLAEASVPDAGGDVAKACLVVFSTAGGSVEENIARWAGQVRDDKGQPVPGKPESRTVNGFKVTTVEMAGAFAGMGDGAPRDNWMLRGAIVETPEGLLFIKMTGPAASMAAAQAGFGALVDSLKKP